MPSTLSNIDLKKRQSLCAVADKMDILMDMTLQHLKNYIDAGQIEEVCLLLCVTNFLRLQCYHLGTWLFADFQYIDELLPINHLRYIQVKVHTGKPCLFVLC